MVPLQILFLFLLPFIMVKILGKWFFNTLKAKDLLFDLMKLELQIITLDVKNIHEFNDTLRFLLGLI